MDCPTRLALWVLVSTAAGATGCRQVRGRKTIQEANELYKRGRYPRRSRCSSAREALVPDLPTLWLNKGYTCRQLIARRHAPRAGAPPPARWRRSGGCEQVAPERSARRAADGADLVRHRRLRDAGEELPRAAHAAERRAARLDVVHGLRRSTTSGGSGRRRWSGRRGGDARPNDAEAQYGVGTFIWQILAARGGGPDMAAYDPRRAGDAAPAGSARVAHAPKPKAAAPPPTPPPPPASRRRRHAARRGRARRPGDRASGEGGRAAPALPGRDDVPGAGVAAEVVRVVRRAGALAAAVDEANEWQREAGGAQDRESCERWRSRHFSSGGDPRPRRRRAPLVRRVDGGARRADGGRHRLLVLAHRGAVAAAGQGDVHVGGAAAAGGAASPAGGGAEAPKKKVDHQGEDRRRPSSFSPARSAEEGSSPSRNPKTEDPGDKRRRWHQGRHHRRHARRHHRRHAPAAPSAARRADTGPRRPGPEVRRPRSALCKRVGRRPRVSPRCCGGRARSIACSSRSASRAPAAVDRVTIMKGADALLDGNVVSAVKTWRYRPLMADNHAVPFCYFGRFEFKSNRRSRSTKQERHTWISRWSDSGTRWGSSPAASCWCWS